jgi:hypothetical protein
MAADPDNPDIYLVVSDGAVGAELALWFFSELSLPTSHLRPRHSEWATTIVAWPADLG